MSKVKKNLGKNVAEECKQVFYDTEKPSSSHILKLNFRHHSWEWCTLRQAEDCCRFRSAAAIGGLETGDGQGEINAALESRAPFFKVMHFELPRRGVKEHTQRQRADRKSD